MMCWESGLAVCEIGGASDPRAHFHCAEPLACDSCGEFACDAHGNRSPVDEDWLCLACFDAEAERLAASDDSQEERP